MENRRYRLAHFHPDAPVDSALDSTKSRSGGSGENLKQEAAAVDKDDRKVGRIEQNGFLTYSFSPSGYRYNAELINLSSNGMRLIAEEKLEPSTDIEIQSPLISGAAIVKHCCPAWRNNRRVYLIGIWFKKQEFDRPQESFLDLKA